MIEAIGPFTVSPRWRAVFSIAAVFAASIAEADKLRRVREAGRVIEPRNPLGEVMAQSGLQLPTLGEMLAQFLGDSPEAKKAASLITQNPDPAKLLQTLVGGFGPAASETPGAGKETASATPSSPPSGAAAAAEAPSSTPTTTPETSTKGEPCSPPPKFRPDFAPRTGSATLSPTASTETSPRFADVVERRMIAILDRARVWHTALMSRVAECKAELADLRRGRTDEGPVPAPVPSIEPESAESTEAAQLVAELIAEVAEHEDVEVSSSAPADESAEDEDPTDASDQELAAEDSTSEPDMTLAPEAPESADVDDAEPLPPATAEEALAALEIIETYERQIDELHEASQRAVDELCEDLRQYKAEADAA